VESVDFVAGVLAVAGVGAGGITRAAAGNVLAVLTGESGFIVKVA